MFPSGSSKDMAAEAALKQRLLPRPVTPTLPAAGRGRAPPPPGHPRPLQQAAEQVVNRRGHRGQGTRSWIRIDKEGNTQIMEVDKASIMKRCELPARDLRLLDPVFVYPSTILGREKAIVVNLEQIRCIITADEVLLLSTLEYVVHQYVQELQRRVKTGDASDHAAFQWRGAGGMSAEAIKRSSSFSLIASNGTGNDEEPLPVPRVDGSAAHRSTVSDYDMFSGAGGLADHLPFEFRALEVALEAACSQLDSQVTQLELNIYPTLDALTANITTLNLDKVRRLKTQLLGLTRRVEKVRAEIEQLMDDDGDMAEMYLTEKKERAEAMASHTPSTSTPFGSPPAELILGDDTKTSATSSPSRSLPPSPPPLQHGFRSPPKGIFVHHFKPFSDRFQGPTDLFASSASPRHAASHADDATLRDTAFFRCRRCGRLRDDPEHLSACFLEASRSFTSRKSMTSEIVDSVDELEMLLEAYFVVIDGTLNKLTQMKEYIDDTEDYINIQLDNTRNQLIQFEILLTTATFVVGIYGVVAGVFGMNIDIDIFHKPWAFKWVLLDTFLAGLGVFLATVWYLHYKRLLPIG